MIDFKPVTLGDKKWMDELIHSADLRSADFSFANIYIWDESYKQSIAKYDGMLLIRLDMRDAPYYALPVGSGDFKDAVKAVKAEADEMGHALHINGIFEERLDDFERFFPGQFKFQPVEFSWDYLYTVEKLANLSGKKLHGKRNHINRFIENNDWSFELITSANIQECLDMDEHWNAANTDELGNSYTLERKALVRAMEHFDELELEGGIVRSSGELIAFSVGERLCSDTYVTHFEKAFAEIQGSYAIINREIANFVQEKYPEIIYINREDDMGIESLRKAKRSYYPDIIIKKYAAHYITD